ncbi:MAG: hypothetical protein C4335_11795 [Armatimonadota bacterium]
MVVILLGIFFLTVGAEIVLREENRWFYTSFRSLQVKVWERWCDSEVMQDAISLLLFLIVAPSIYVLLSSVCSARAMWLLVVLGCLLVWYRMRQVLRQIQVRWYEILVSSQRGVRVLGIGYMAIGILWIVFGVAELLR